MKTLSLDRVFATAATIAVGVGVVAGFWLVGSPSRQRSIAADQQRWQDLDTIADKLHQDYLADPSHYQLPQGLSSDASPTDPITNQPYGYQRLSDRRYQLCASFATDSRRDPLVKNSQRSDQTARQHPQGRHCRGFDVSRSPD